MDTDIAIIGGGLSGLAVADGLGRRDWRLFEARDRLGGRVSTWIGASDGAPYDMGPAWIWPHNRRLLAALDRFGLTAFEQYAKGTLVFQDAEGVARRDLAMAPMAGSLRVAGGLAGLIAGYRNSLVGDAIHLSRRLVAVARGARGVSLQFQTRAGRETVSAARAVLALPPRLLAETVAFDPGLPPEAKRAMSSTPTWMAGHAKLLAIYPTPFWRAAGLSGDAISHRGPLAEIHDAGAVDGGKGALFGFVGVPAARRSSLGDRLEDAAVAQLEALFGPEAARPEQVMIKDWAQDSETATGRDWDPPRSHPAYGMPSALRAVWDGRLLFAGTEVAATEGGFLEGALEAAEACLAGLAD